jgi:hypothetical protein
MIEWRGAVPEVVGFSYPGHRGPWIIASGASAAARKHREDAIARRDAGLSGFVVKPDELLRNARGAKRNNIAALEDEIRLLVHSDQGPTGSATNNKARAVLAQLQ